MLVADDSQEDVFLLRRAFDKAGINAQMEFFENGNEVLDYFRGKKASTSSAIPHLVFLDIKMPGLSGFEVLEWIRQQQEFGMVPVVMFSSSELPADVDRAHELGANGYLAKPYGMEGYRAVVAAVDQFWLRQHKYPSCCGKPLGAS